MTGVALDGQDNIYVTGPNNDRIEKFSPTGQQLPWGPAGSGAAQLSHPQNLALDGQGNVYATESGLSTLVEGRDRIQKFSPTGTQLAQWGGHGSQPGQFDSPVGIALDRQNNIYVADLGNHRIQKLSPLGEPLAQWGSLGRGPGLIGSPFGITVDTAGNIFISDVAHNDVQVLSPTGKPLALWGEGGAGHGQFKFPAGVAVDEISHTYVLDTENGRIQKLDPAGQYVRHWAIPRDCGSFQSSQLVLRKEQLYFSVGNRVMKHAVG